MIPRPRSLARRRLRRRETGPEVPAPEIRVSDHRGAGTPLSPTAAAPVGAPTTDGDSPQDETTYRCGCGYVFHAAVSTTVACPYCGDAQAW